MTERAYVTVDRAILPRIIEVAGVGSGGSNEITLQDLHDTLNSNTLPAGDPDDSLDNMDDDFLIDSAGKEELGGGTRVGITSTLQDAQVAFEGNYTPAQTGSATAADTGTTLTDTSATFITNGVERGAIIINFDDRSVSEILKVVSETVLEHRPLQGGIQNDWDIGENYAIFNIIQKEISGGNLVSLDNIGDPQSPVFPTFATQIIRTSSASATLQELQDIQYSSFGGGVTLDTASPHSGTTYPTGTPRQAVNNLADAVTIATTRGFTTLFVIGDITLDAAAALSQFQIVGQSPNQTTITIQAAADVSESEITQATVTGTLDGGNVISNCVINDLIFVDGILLQCVLDGVITLSAVEDAHFLDCWSGVPGVSMPTIDFNGAGSGAALRNYNGGILLRNKSGSESVSIDLNSGQILLDDTVTAGTVVMRGVGTWANEDTYAGGATVIDQTLNTTHIVETLNNTLYDGRTFSDIQNILLAMAQGRIRETAIGSGVFEFYAQDNATILYTLTKTATERQRS